MIVNLTVWAWIVPLVMLLSISGGVWLRIQKREQATPSSAPTRLCSSCSLPTATSLLKSCPYCGHHLFEAKVRQSVVTLGALLLLGLSGISGIVFLPPFLQATPQHLEGFANALQSQVSQEQLGLLSQSVMSALKLPPHLSVPPLPHAFPDQQGASSITETATVSSANTSTEQTTRISPTSDMSATSKQESVALNPFVSRNADTPTAPENITANEAGSTGAASNQQGEAPRSQVLTCGGLVPDTEPEPNFDNYISAIQTRIRQHWKPPNVDQTKRIVVAYQIGCHGNLLQTRILESSGIRPADQAAIKAIQESAPFPALPANYRGQVIEVQFTFDYDMLTRKPVAKQ